jgi:hypothetical protein
MKNKELLATLVKNLEENKAKNEKEIDKLNKYIEQRSADDTEKDKQLLNLQKEYYQKLSQVIPESKLVKLEGLENEFRKMLYQRLKD